MKFNLVFSRVPRNSREIHLLDSDNTSVREIPLLRGSDRSNRYFERRTSTLSFEIDEIRDRCVAEYGNGRFLLAPFSFHGAEGGTYVRRPDHNESVA